MDTETIKKETSCVDDFDPSSLPADIASAKILESINPVQTSETIAIRSAIGRILAEEIISPINVPGGTNSAMDGYAINSNDIPSSGTTELKVAGTALAGKPWIEKLLPGQCVRIMTGAIMPDGADTVVMQEHVEAYDQKIRMDSSIQAGSNVRLAGEDIAIGDKILERGMEITPADIGLIASLGIPGIKVFRSLKIVFFSTGDELRSIGESLADGQIYDSNRYTLYGMLNKPGIEIIDMGVIRDNPEELKQAFEKASSNADILITSGGVSVGEADYVKDILAEVGKVNFWKVAMKPGRPLAFGKIKNCWFFGLPGNPVSVMVTFYQFVQPAIRHLMGAKMLEPIQFSVTCTSKLKKRPGRVEYQRGILSRNEKGELTVRKTGMQGSGILRSMSQANCFIVLPMDSGEVIPGTKVNVQPFFGLV